MTFISTNWKQFKTIKTRNFKAIFTDIRYMKFGI